MRLWAPIIVVGVACIACSELDAQGKYTVLGVGGQSCGRYVNDRKNDGIEANIKDAWVGGFLSAYNASGIGGTRDISADIDFDGIRGWLQNYCTAHPLDNIADATVSLANELRRRKAAK